MGVGILVTVLLGIICWCLDKDPAKPTLDDFTSDISNFRGVTAPLFIVLYILTILFVLYVYPYMTVIRWIEEKIQ